MNVILFKPKNSMSPNLCNDVACSSLGTSSELNYYAKYFPNIDYISFSFFIKYYQV